MERIGYVLRRNGKEVGEAEQLEDMTLIAEVMEVREAIDHSTGNALEKLKAANDGERDSWCLWLVLIVVDKIQDVLEGLEAAVGDEEWGRAKRLAVRLKYLESIEDAIKRAENAE